MEYFRRLGNFWGPDGCAVAWFFLALPALYFFHTVIHEGMHGLAVVATSDASPKVAPFPHLNEDGDFLNGVTITEGRYLVTIQRPQSCANRTVVPMCRSSWR
ncbi:MAG: hypothetical protein ACYTGZ_07915 [Planctomycetota bacterium]|jgi:hypothetical protein